MSTEEPQQSHGGGIGQRLKTVFGQLTAAEISGSLGDLGTLIPLLVGLARDRSVLLAPALFFGGLANVITGIIWDVPMCVQPMKSISAIALSEGLSQQDVTAAGIVVGCMILFIGASNLIELINVIIPSNVVSGLQIGVGLRLAGKGIKNVNALTWVDTYDSRLLAVFASALCCFWLRDSVTVMGCGPSCSGEKKEVAEPKQKGKIMGCLTAPFQADQEHPVGIYLFVIGAIFSIITLVENPNNQDFDRLQFFGAPVAVWALDDVTGENWKTGTLEGAIPQIPLTTLNSVISVCALAHSLYPEKIKPGMQDSNDGVIGRKDVAISVGLMNILFCPFGSMPNCHGAGGLAGQHRLGARHGASVLFLGFWKMILAIFFGKSALTLLDAFPASILGVMLAIAGQELATTGFTLLVTSVDKQAARYYPDEESGLNGPAHAKTRKQLMRQNTVICIITVMVIIALGKTHYGALSGWFAFMIYGPGTTDFISWVNKKRGVEEEVTK